MPGSSGAKFPRPRACDWFLSWVIFTDHVMMLTNSKRLYCLLVFNNLNLRLLIPNLYVFTWNAKVCTTWLQFQPLTDYLDEQAIYSCNGSSCGRLVALCRWRPVCHSRDSSEVASWCQSMLGSLCRTGRCAVEDARGMLVTPLSSCSLTCYRNMAQSFLGPLSYVVFFKRIHGLLETWISLFPAGNMLLL